jgi:hypothetical protein
MKEYNAPKMNFIELRSEESISATAECYVGSCDENLDGIYEYVAPSASAG